MAHREKLPETTAALSRFLQTWPLADRGQWLGFDQLVGAWEAEQAKDPLEDLDRDRVDLAITLGSSSVENYQHWKFVDEEVFPVCSPDFLRQQGPIRDVKTLAKLPLMHLEERYKSRIGWTDWLKSFGVALKRENAMFRFNDYSIVLQAAIEGQGVALGWKHLVDPLIAQGLLVRPLSQSDTTDQPIYVIAPKNTELRSDVLNLKNWLIEEAKK